ncbi:hypothetical protein BJV82DRAFT_604492 [Fennellomyces sp. T-0311]|nr:hypothetical protein BJV82DRAFT_604492 [Fennellomyces sp. T-0311]
MKIYRAETGRHVRWSSQNATIDSLDQFKQAIKECTGVPIDCQILMTSFGTQVRASQLDEVITATGDKEYLVFLYDRQYLNATDEEVTALLDLETPSLEQKLPPFDGPSSIQALARAKAIASPTLTQTCQLYKDLFGAFDSYSQILIQTVTTHARLSKVTVDELKMQSMAINVAMTNLESHSYMANQNITSFCAFAEKELTTHSALVDATELNLTVLHNVRLHPAILRSINSASEQMIDFVDTERIETAKASTQELCTSLGLELQELHDLAIDLKHYEKDLQRQITEDQDLHSLDAVVSDIQDILKKAQFLRERIKRDLSRVHGKISELMPRDEGRSPDFGIHPGSNAYPTLTSHAKKTLEAFSHLAEIHVNDYLPKLHAYENDIRRKTITLVLAKRKSIEQFLENMNIISQLQSEIAAVAPRIESANKWVSDFQAEHHSSNLDGLQEMIFAYGYLLIEVVRRKEYNAILAESANAIADLLAGYREEETQRREEFVRKMMRMLPFQVTEIQNESTSHCEVSMINARDNKLDISRKDIIEFIRILSQYYGSAQTQSTKPSNRLSFSSITRGSSPSESLFRRTHGSKAAIQTSFTRGTDKFVDLLHAMSQQLDGLRGDFFKALETTFFASVTDSPVGEHRGLSKERTLLSFNTLEMELRQKNKALSTAEEKTKKYEQRIVALEKALEKKNMDVLHDAPSSVSSSAYSVLEDGSAVAGQQSPQLVPQSDGAEVDQLKEIVREQENMIASLQRQLHNEQNKIEVVREQNEHEKEDLRLQVQELEQLLEEERQTYEDNRKSLLKEAQIKDNLADIRIASAEEDWRAKIQELQAQIEQQQAETQKRTEALEQAHQRRMDSMQAEYEDRIEKMSQGTLDLQKRHALLQDEFDNYRATTDAEKIAAEQRLKQLDDTEHARDAIKQQLAKTRDMVSRAENDWLSKHQALEHIVAQRRNIHGMLVALLSRYGRADDATVGEEEIHVLLDILRECLDAFAQDISSARQRFAELEQSHAQLLARLSVFEEERAGVYSTAAQMAEKLEDIRKNIFYEVTNQLQLAVDEEEAKAMTKKIIVSGEHDDMAVWTRVLQVIGTIDSVKFVGGIRSKVRDAHDLTRRWKQEYKELREKYNKVSSSGREKIAFRNFQVGDVALFLPTRNSTGKPWAAFNINAPHYFLKPSNSDAQQIITREWLVARITSITEHVVNAADPQSNPYGLSDGLTYYHLEVENWKHSRHRRSHKSQKGKASTKGKEPDTMAASSSTIKGYTTSTPDTGLASISDTRSEHSAASPSNITRPPFPLSLSASSVVHSYVPPNSPPISVADRERRHSIGFFSQERSQLDSTMVWTHAHQ